MEKYQVLLYSIVKNNRVELLFYDLLREDPWKAWDLVRQIVRN
jgi:hypothetical protein